MPAVQIDEEKLKLLRTRISEVLAKPRAAWCVACGAGAKGVRDLVSNPQLFREVIAEESVTAAFSRISIDAIKADTDWCVACGAAAVSREVLGMPGPDLDRVMEEVVAVLRK